MENAHLTKAHEYVRNAATATLGNSIASAGEAHALAAESFHEAAQDTHDAEALRILALLEDHHTKLAHLIKAPPRKKEKSRDGASHIPEKAAASSTAQSMTAARTASPPARTSSPRAPSRRRLPHSSIASNLAEKRGIPGARRGMPTASPVSVTNALAARSDRPPTAVMDLLQQQSRKAEEASRRKDVASTKEKSVPASRDVSPPPDDNFRRFYAAFGGVINAISAPLAFTSLPLSPNTSSTTKPDPAPPSPTKQKSKPKPKPKPLDASRTIKSSEPDLASLISKPALHALRDDQAAPLGPFANNESFYFVPTSGGTVSYASIVRDPQAHLHHAAQDPHLDSIAEGDAEGGTAPTSLRGSSHEEFVDARESIGPPSPTTTRRPRSKGSATTGVTTAANIRAGRGTGQKTMEELQLENETLRNLIDKQAKRLSMWETTSQSSYNALAQSFRARGGLNKQISDPSALAQALTAMGSASSPPPVPSVPPQYQHHIPPQQAKSNTSDADRAKQRQRIAELEAMLASQAEQLEALSTEKEQLSRQNEKNTQVIGRYREQWEKLKAGARKKELERRERRVAELKQGADQGKDSESGENEAVEEGIEVEAGAGFGKA